MAGATVAADGGQHEGLAHERRQAHDAGRVPTLRTCGHRANRALHGGGRALSRALAGGAGIGPRAPAPCRARAWRTLRRRAARCRRDRPSRSHALAVAQLLRLLSGQRFRSLDPRRPPLLRSRGPGHALGDQPRVHRARDPCARLAGRSARAAGAVPLDRGRRRRHPGQRIEQYADGASHSPRARERRRGQPARRRPRPHGRAGAAAHRLHLAPRPLLDREGGEDRGPGAREPAARRRRRPSLDARRRAGGGDRRRSRSRGDACDGLRDRGHDVVGRRGSAARHRRTLPPRGDLAPRRCRARGQRHHLPRAPGPDRRGGLCRQLYRQPAQVAAHQLRLQLLLGCRPCRADRCAERPSRILAQSRDGVRCGHRLPRLAGAARPPLSRAQALVRHPPLRRGRLARPCSQEHRTRRMVRGAGGGERGIRAGRAGLGRARLLPPSRAAMRSTRP